MQRGQHEHELGIAMGRVSWRPSPSCFPVLFCPADRLRCAGHPLPARRCKTRRWATRGWLPPRPRCWMPRLLRRSRRRPPPLRPDDLGLPVLELFLRRGVDGRGYDQQVGRQRSSLPPPPLAACACAAHRGLQRAAARAAGRGLPRCAIRRAAAPSDVAVQAVALYSPDAALMAEQQQEVADAEAVASTLVDLISTGGPPAGPQGCWCCAQLPAAPCLLHATKCCGAAPPPLVRLLPRPCLSPLPAPGGPSACPPALDSMLFCQELLLIWLSWCAPLPYADAGGDSIVSVEKGRNDDGSSFVKIEIASRGEDGDDEGGLPPGRGGGKGGG